MAETTSSTQPEPGALRASDADREAAVERLRAHAAAGRLDPDELDERLERAFAARTAGELSELMTDLPAQDAPRRSSRDRSGRRAHFATYARVMLLLVAIWALTGAGYFWPVWPMLGWGVAVLMHARPGGLCGRRRLSTPTPHV